jgi:hypothetical protein
MSDRIGSADAWVNSPLSPCIGPFSDLITTDVNLEWPTMSMSLFRMMQLHQKLDDAISHEHKRRLPDVFRLMKLKRMKLVVKDRLHRLGLGRRHLRAI